jgi:hypothetical protein
VPKVLDWRGLSADGLPLTRAEFIGTGNLPMGVVREMVVATDHPAAPRVKAKCSPEADESIRVFTRRTAPFSAGGGPVGEADDTVVIEIANAVTPGRFVRMYLRNDGIVLSSEELHG